MKQLLVYIMILLIVGVVLAADPPRIDDYKVKVEAAIFDSCTAVADMYPDRPTTLNLRATYYDGTKVLTELINLYGNTSIGDYNVSMCLSQAAEINAERYIDTFPNEAGYTRFPHGLYYDYITTGDTESLNGFDAIRDGTNWDQVNIGANQQIIYSREVAYSIQMYTRAYVLGRPHANQDELINHFVDMALSHLEQWHTGDFLGDFERNDYRQSFMAGLTMNALIEYYEYYDADERIPVAIKYTVDDLWAQAWWPDVTNPSPQTVGDASSYATSAAEGAFWYWMDWNETNQEWNYDSNRLGSSQDVGADTNMLIGPAYMWYSLYSGDSSYRTKALDVWDGMIANAWFGNDGRHQWEASRNVDDFIRWYRQDTGSTCSSSMINICYTQADCTNAGGNWNGVTCQYLPVTYVVTDYIKPSGTLVIRYYSDYDGDGYGTGDYQEVEVHPGEDWYISAELMAITGDCNDSDSLVYSNISCSYNGSVCVDYDFCGLACPEVPVEICGNGVDEDCDGVADEGCGECHEADTSGDCDGVDTGELGEYLERWARGEVSMGDVLGAVGVWRG